MKSVKLCLAGMCCFSALWAGVTARGQDGPVRTGKPVDKVPANGIFCLLEGDKTDRPVRNLAERSCWTNPNVDGVALRTFWDKVEPENGKFDWSHFDEGVRLASRHHKRLTIAVAAGIHTPAWAYEAGVPRFAFRLKTNFMPDQDAVMPLPWGNAFLQLWGTLVRALGQRYDGESAVAYITIGGPGFGYETYFVRTPEGIEKFKSLGGVSPWVEGTKAIIDAYAGSFQKTPFILAGAPPIPDQDGLAALQEVAGYGAAKYPGRFGLMHHGLNAQSSNRFPPFQMIQSLSEKTPVGFQMVWSTKGENAKQVRGTLRQALERGVELGAHFIEVYEADCNDPAYGPDLRDMRGKLKP